LFPNGIFYHYAILRSIPDKLAGVLALAFAIVSLFLLPILHKPEVRSMVLRPFSRFLFWCFVTTTFILGWIGAKPVAYPFLEIGQATSFAYFAYFFLMAPFIIYVEFFFFTARFDKDVGHYVFGFPKHTNFKKK